MIKPGENLKLKLIYNPTIPYLRDVENFEFVDSSFNIIKIKVVGNCIGKLEDFFYFYEVNPPKIF